MGNIITETGTEIIDNTGDFLQKLRKAQGRMVSDCKGRVPGLIKKAVRRKYPRTPPKDPDLIPGWKLHKAGSKTGTFILGLETGELVYTGKRKSLTLADVPTPFKGRGVLGSRKRKEADPSAPDPEYAKGWVDSSRPWRVQTPLGIVPFGDSKTQLFARPSKNGVPLLFQRRSAERKDFRALQTLAIPQEVVESEAIWRPKLNEFLLKRLKNHYGKIV